MNDIKKQDEDLDQFMIRINGVFADHWAYLLDVDTTFMEKASYIISSGASIVNYALTETPVSAVLAVYIASQFDSPDRIRGRERKNLEKNLDLGLSLMGGLGFVAGMGETAVGIITNNPELTHQGLDHLTMGYSVTQWKAGKYSSLRQ